LACRCDIPKETVRRILKEDLGLIKKLSSWIPHTLTEDQKEMRFNIAQANLSRHRSRPSLLKRIIAIDESWVPIYSPPARHQSKSWVKPGTPGEKIPRSELHERKLLLTVGMDIDGVAFWDVLEFNQTMTAERYKSFLERFVTKWQTDKDIRRPVILHEF